jgi:hypothetical protein
MVYYVACTVLRAEHSACLYHMLCAQQDARRSACYTMCCVLLPELVFAALTLTCPNRYFSKAVLHNIPNNVQNICGLNMTIAMCLSM